MAWCFSTRASVATVLTTHPCVSQGFRVNVLTLTLHIQSLNARPVNILQDRKAQDDLPDVGIVCQILTVCDGEEKYC